MSKFRVSASRAQGKNMAAKKKSVNPKAALIRAEKLSDEARDALANGEIKEGVKLYEEAIAADPTFEWAYYGLAEELGRQGRVDEQIKLLNSGLAKIKSASLYDSLGAAYQRIEDLEKAVTCFKNAIDIDSNAHYSYANLGAAYIQGGQFEAAEQAYDRALQILPGYHFALAGLGSLAEKRGSLAEAIRFYERAESGAQREGAAGLWDPDLLRLKSLLKETEQWAELPTIQEMQTHLDRFVQGQVNAKRLLTTAIYNHFISVSYKESHPLHTDLGRFNVLIFGPSGSGKTYMSELLTRKLNVPIVVVNATSLVQTGYVGKRVDSIMEDLLIASNFSVARAERGIVFIDEIDKVRKQGGSGGPDVSGEGVQNALLTMLEGSEFRIQNDRGNFVINSGKVLFLGAGAFDGIVDIVKRRIERGANRLGFGALSGNNTKLSDAEILQRTSVEDLEEYGIIPQLAGRFSAIASLHPLSREDLRKILTTMENSVLGKYQKLFALHGIELKFTDAAIEALLDMSIGSKTGARGLRSGLSQALREVSNSITLYAEQGISQVTITEAVVRNWEPPELTPAPNGAVDDSVAKRLREEAFSGQQRE